MQVLCAAYATFWLDDDDDDDDEMPTQWHTRTSIHTDTQRRAHIATNNIKFAKVCCQVESIIFLCLLCFCFCFCMQQVAFLLPHCNLPASQTSPASVMQQHSPALVERKRYCNSRRHWTIGHLDSSFLAPQESATPICPPWPSMKVCCNTLAAVASSLLAPI